MMAMLGMESVAGLLLLVKLLERGEGGGQEVVEMFHSPDGPDQGGALFTPASADSIQNQRNKLRQEGEG